MNKPSKPQPNKPGQPGHLVAVQREYSGPIPHPAILEHYEKVSPGIAAKIIQWTEDEGKHRRELDRKEQDANIDAFKIVTGERKRGQTIGAIIAILWVVASTLIILKSQTDTGQIVGGVLGSTCLVSLVTVFITGRKPEKQ